ncbi:MAG: hypothetical protein ABIH68_02745 [bacterium]
MKMFGVAVTLFFLTSISCAEIGKVKVSGSLEVQKVSLNNSTDYADYDKGANDDAVSETRSRLLLGLEAPVSEGVAGKILLSKNNRKYGTGEESVGSTQWQINIKNAYLVLDDFLDIFKVTLGRQFIGEKGDLALYYGPTQDDNLSITAVDGATAETTLGSIDASFISGKLTESNATPSQDVDLSGVILKSGKLLSGVELGAYAYQKIDRTNLQFNRDDLRIYGIKAQAGIPQVEGLNTKLEYAMNAGADNNADQKHSGNALIVGVSYEGVNVGGPLKVSADYAAGSGDKTSADKNEDFKSVSSDLRYGEIWANSLGNVGITDRNIIKVGVGYEPDFSNRLSASLDYLTFTESEVASGANDDWGSEIDLRVKWQQSENVALEVVAAQLQPGDAMTGGGTNPNDPIAKIAANLKVSF